MVGFDEIPFGKRPIIRGKLAVSFREGKGMSLVGVVAGAQMDGNRLSGAPPPSLSECHIPGTGIVGEHRGNISISFYN